MNKQRELERQLNGVGERVRERARHYADETASGASELIERGRRATRRLGRVDYRKQLSHAAEDMADEAQYQYRRARRQIRRHPVATTAIVAGTVGAFLLLRQLFRDRGEE